MDRRERTGAHNTENAYGTCSKRLVLRFKSLKGVARLERLPHIRRVYLVLLVVQIGQQRVVGSADDVVVGVLTHHLHRDAIDTVVRDCRATQLTQVPSQQAHQTQPTVLPSSADSTHSSATK
jgi:hypothetical protein